MFEMQFIATIFWSLFLVFLIIGLFVIINRKSITVVELTEHKKNLLEKNSFLEESVKNFQHEIQKYKDDLYFAKEKALDMEKECTLLKTEMLHSEKSYINSVEHINRENSLKLDSLIKEKNIILENFNSYKKELDLYKEKVSEEFKMQFTNIANAVLKDNSKTFNEASQKDLNNILTPLKEKIKDFQGKVEQTYSEQSREQHSLKNEIKRLIEETSRTKFSTDSLVGALRGNNKVLGNWGEILLSNILENSGLQKNRDYVVQTAVSDNSIPDVVVRLPDDKHVIIDAKTTFGKYEEYCCATDDKIRAELLQSFIALIKKHITVLAKKEYQHGHRIDTPNFVLMFIPIEPAYILALNADADVYNFALQNNIFLVSPTSLMATLRTIAYVWNKENQSKNAIDIAEKAGDMYDKFVCLLTKIEEIGKGIKRMSVAYEDTIKYLSSGNGNLCKRSEELKKMGAKARKSMQASFIDPCSYKDNELNVLYEQLDNNESLESI